MGMHFRSNESQRNNSNIDQYPILTYESVKITENESLRKLNIKPFNIYNPKKTRYIQLHEWMIRFCQGNLCAAMLLAIFYDWHRWKIKQEAYYGHSHTKANGDGRPISNEVYCFYSDQELFDRLMGLYTFQDISSALNFLVSLNAISIHSNPNSQPHLGQTKYFKIYPLICSNNKNISKEPALLNENTHSALPLSPINSDTIKHTNDTPQISNQNIDFSSKKLNTKNKELLTVQIVIDVMSQNGFSANYFSSPDTVKTIQTICEGGVTIETFFEAYATARRITSGGYFGINYLAMIVADLHNNIKAKKLEWVSSS